MKQFGPSSLALGLILLCLTGFAVSGQGQSVRSVAGTPATGFPCIQKMVSLDDVATYRDNGSRNLTVRDKLIEIKARCRGHRLIDRKGRPIYFYPLQGCWGNPPEDAQAILAEQAKELVRLRRKYRVIEMACDRRSLV